MASAQPLEAGLFVNPVGEGADPSVVRDGDRYLWCQSEGNVGIAIWVSDRLTSMGRKHVVWHAPAQGPCSREVWAPELVRLDDRWYIYFAADDGDNRNHQAFVLESETDDPLGGYRLHGPLFTGDGDEPAGTNLWAIDMTVLEHQGTRYAIWSGWPEAGHNLQHLYISAMRSPVDLSGPRVLLREAGEFDWQRTEETPDSRGLLEAPQVLSRGDRTFVAYSCAASWLPTYKLGMLELTGPDPLEPTDWTSFPEPVFASTSETYGVGHGAFVRSRDEREWWHVYHCKLNRDHGWQRFLQVQPMTWSDEGVPDLGEPVRRGQPLATPAGTPAAPHARALTRDLTVGPEALDGFDYYGHHQFFELRPDGLHLGVEPRAPVNAYRSGEKVVLRDGDYRNVRVTTHVAIQAGQRAVGVLVRTTAPAVGFDALRGYFAGIVPGRGRLVIGKMDGANFTVLAEAPYDVDTARLQHLTVEAVGSTIVARAEDTSVTVTDGDFPTGSVGLRVVNTHARFESLHVNL